jgi:predicted ester cyclase
MEIRRVGAQPSGKGPAEWFTGSVRIDPLFQAPDPAFAQGASVTFEPGARTAWHTHPLGHQLRSGVPADAVPRGPEAIKEHVTSWIASFPDLHFSIEQMLSEGDRVVMQLLMEGTHQGAWLGIPASGKMQIRMFTVHRVVQDKIIEGWVLVESLGVF